MNSALISVGTELLFGQITNTNSVYLSKELNALGIDVLYHYTVGDNPDRLKDTLKQAMEKCDLIMTTGGLGPTQDDLTKEIVTEVMGDSLVLHGPSLERIEHFFSKANRIMTNNNIKQAYLPQTATIFQNDCGTAPGFAIEKEGKIIICLPGPPREMKHMFENKVLPYLEEKSSCVIFSKILRLFGIGESAVETEIEDLISLQTDPTLATYAKEGEVTIRITSKRKSQQEAEEAVAEMIDIVKQRLGEYIYSYNNEDLVEVVAKKLIERNITISCAESCTGGLFSSVLTNIPGISSVFDRGIVTYSYASKVQELGVKMETLEKLGAVSSEAAVEMAEGLKRISGSRLCAAITGIAGPGGGSDDKPVGLIYICVILDDKKVCNEYRVRPVSRNWNRQFAVLQMLNAINKLLK